MPKALCKQPHQAWQQCGTGNGMGTDRSMALSIIPVPCLVAAHGDPAHPVQRSRCWMCACSPQGNDLPLAGPTGDQRHEGKPLSLGVACTERTGSSRPSFQTSHRIGGVTDHEPTAASTACRRQRSSDPLPHPRAPQPTTGLGRGTARVRPVAVLGPWGTGGATRAQRGRLPLQPWTVGGPVARTWP